MARDDDSAVSVVLGVMVLVAIVVVLSVSLFVLLSQGNQSERRNSHVGFNQDPHNHAISVATADPDVWTAIRYSFAPGSDPACTIVLNGAPPGTATGGPPASGVVGAVPGELISANDAIVVTGPTPGSGARCILELAHLPLNESYGSWTFLF